MFGWGERAEVSIAGNTYKVGGNNLDNALASKNGYSLLTRLIQITQTNVALSIHGAWTDGGGADVANTFP